MGLSYWLLYVALGALAFTYFIDPRAVSNFRIALLLKPYCATHPQDCQNLLGGSNYGLETREFDNYDMIYLRPWILSRLDKAIIGGMYWVLRRFGQSNIDITYTLETLQIGLAAFYVTVVMITRFILTSRIWLLCFMGIAASVIDSWLVVVKPVQIATQMLKCINWNMHALPVQGDMVSGREENLVCKPYAELYKTRIIEPAPPRNIPPIRLNWFAMRYKHFCVTEGVDRCTATWM